MFAFAAVDLAVISCLLELLFLFVLLLLLIFFLFFLNCSFCFYDINCVTYISTTTYCDL